MINNKRGQTLGIAIVATIFVFIVGILTINFLFPEINTFRTAMGCATPAAISDGTKLLCLAASATVPYWIILIFSITIGALAGRIFK